MGVVVRARDASGRDVALKVLRPDLTDRDAFARFEREQRVQGLLGAEDGFVPVLATGTGESGPFFVMPLLEGGTLRERLSGDRLSVAETLSLGRALARSLARAHAHGIVHRDLKPANVLFARPGPPGPENPPIVGDLGLARAVGRFEESLTRTSEGVGTVGYMAPEQIEDARRVGPGVDVFALGAILYECLAGQRPYGGESLIRYVERLEAGTLVPLRRARPEVPAWLAAVIEKALAVDPRQRFVDALALERALLARRGRGRGAVAVLSGFLVVLAVAGAAKIATTKAPPPPPLRPTAAKHPLLDAARDAVSRKDYAEASRLIERSLAEEGDSALGHHARAILAIAGVRNDVDPERELARALELDARCHQALAARAALRARLGRYPEALDDATRAVAIAPGEVAPHLIRANALRKLGHGQAALAEAEAAVRLDSKDLETLLELMYCHRDGHDSARTVEDADRVLALFPDQKAAVYERALALLQLGRVEEAERGLDRSIELEPHDGHGYASRAHAHMMQSRFEEAALDAQRAIQEGVPDPTDMWVMTGVVLSILDKPGAGAAFDKALELTPEDWDGRIERSKHRFRQNDVKGALEDADHAVATGRETIPSRAWRSFVRYFAGDRAGAKEDADFVLSAPAEPVDAARARCVRGCLVEAVDPDAAARDFEAVLASPDISKDARIVAEARLKRLRGK